MKKLSKIIESIWSDMQDRSAGDVVRKEDDYNPEYVDFGEGTTVYWAVDNLKIDGEIKFNFDDVKDINKNGWRLPTVDEVNQLKWNINISWYDGCNHLKFEDGNELRLATYRIGGFHMWTNELNKKFPTSAYSYGFDNMGIFNIDSFSISFNKLFVFLVKDKKYVNESIWSDMQDRSAGITQRKEDDVNLMSMEDFCDYLNDNYIGKDGHKIIYNETSKRIYTAILKQHVGCYFNISYNYNSNTITMNDDVESLCPELCKMIKKNFKVVKEFVSSDYIQFIIFPPDGSKCTNRFFVDVIDFIIDNADENVLSLKKKHINESIWSDMQDRSAGEIVRREDDVNLLDRDGLFDYIYDLYKQIAMYPLPLKSQTSYKYFSIPIFNSSYKVYKLNCTFDNSKISRIKLMASITDIKDFKQPLIDNFDLTVRDDGSLSITAKDGTVSNQVCMDLIKTIVENAPEPYLKKREN